MQAEPVAALYDEGRVHHIGTFPQLEDQMANFTSDIDRAAAGYSPDRVDALGDDRRGNPLCFLGKEPPAAFR